MSALEGATTSVDEQDATGAEGANATLRMDEREEKLGYLARFSQAEYDSVRQSFATKLDLPIAQLDQEVAKRRKTSEKPKGQIGDAVVPWPEAVDGSELLHNLVKGYQEYLTLVRHAAEAMALWAVFTHAFDAATCNPRLLFKSAEKRSGKTSALRLIADTVARPMPTGNISSASIYRVIELDRPTLLIDEADTFAKKNSELTGILNSGHLESYAFVTRTVGDDHDPRRFSTWAPMALAVIKDLDDTLEDRSIIIPMQRQTKVEGGARKRLRGGRATGLEQLSQKAARWATDHIDQLLDSEPELPDELDDRAADNWEPLFAIADAIGGDWPKRARQAAIALSGDNESTSEGIELLSDIRQIFYELDVDRLPSKQVVRELCALSDRRWNDLGYGRKITANQVANILQHYRICPGTTHFNGELRTKFGWEKPTAKGYRLDQFRDAFTRYLEEPARASDTAGIPELKAKASCQKLDDLTDAATLSKLNSAISDDLTGMTATPERSETGENVLDGLLSEIQQP